MGLKFIMRPCCFRPQKVIFVLRKDISHLKKSYCRKNGQRIYLYSELKANKEPLLYYTCHIILLILPPARRGWYDGVRVLLLWAGAGGPGLHGRPQPLPRHGEFVRRRLEAIQSLEIHLRTRTKWSYRSEAINNSRKGSDRKIDKYFDGYIPDWMTKWVSEWVKDKGFIERLRP